MSAARRRSRSAGGWPGSRAPRRSSSSPTCPQVAAFADRQLLVEKTNDGSVTRSGVTVLDGEERVSELSRMLAGLEDSELGRAHAEELLAAAKAAR